LVTFLAELAVFFLGEAPFFGLGEDLTRGMVEVGFACESSTNAFLEELDDFDGAFVGVVG